MKEERWRGKVRSWWTAVGVFTWNITLLQMFSRTHRKREREREKERQRDVSDWSFSGLCQVGLIMVCFTTSAFIALCDWQPFSGESALSQDEPRKQTPD